MFVLECLDAKHGDSLILHYGKKTKPKYVLIDGGPAGTYSQRLKPRLEELRGKAGNQPLMIELGMVSHIDADHITGIIDLFKDLTKQASPDKRLVEFKKFWHNSLAHLVADVSIASTAAVQEKLVASTELAIPQVEAASDHDDHRSSLILASVKQGADLEKLLVPLGLQENTPFSGPVKSGRTDPIALGDLSLTVIWPDAGRLSALKKEWKAQTSSIVAAFTDNSVANRSAIVAIAECEGKSILLTGDARGDDLLVGLEAAGKLKDGKCRFDVLKMPHHGSSHNMTMEFLRVVLADIYVFSADGKHDNPDAETLNMLMEARPEGGYTAVITNTAKMEKTKLQKAYDETVARLKAQPNVKVNNFTQCQELLLE